MIKPYENYKESGVDWLGNIPENWDYVKLSRYVAIIGGSTPKSGIDEYWDGQINWVTTDDLGKLKGREIVTTRRTITQKGLDNCSANLVKKNAVILSSRAPIGHLGILKIDAATNQGCKALIPIKGKFNSEYLYYFLLMGKSELQNLGTGSTFMEVSSQVLKSFKLLIPTLEEQTAIAHYLDYQTGIIDELITQKEKLIELLKEKRQAVINEAVTKGLDPNAKMKDSGIDGGGHRWLVEIPEEWEVTKLKFLAKLNPSKSEVQDSVLDDDVVSFLPMEKVGEDWSYDEQSTAKYGQISSGLTYFREGDLIMAKITPCFENGKAAILESLTNGFGFGSTEFHTIRPLKVDKRYLFYVTRSDYFMSNGESFMTGSAGQKRVPTSFVNDFFVPLPKSEEQIKIADFIESYIEKSNKVATELELQIDKLKEYRQSLISEAVTGKIDVRAWQAPNQNVAA
jgi:type I restriction enzyme S subunit